MTADTPGSSTSQSPPADRLSSSSSSPSPSSSITIALIVWLLIQLTAIALAASGVRLSANFPEPPRSVAVHEMLIAQFIGSALFLSVLFHDGWRAWLAMVITAGPMLMLAAWVAQMPMSRVVLPWAEVGLWLTMLALWRAVVARPNVSRSEDQGSRSPGLLRALAAFALLLSAGGLLWWYLRLNARLDNDLNLLICFPLGCALHHLGGPLNFAPLLSTAALSAGAIVILAGKASLCRPRSRSECD